MAGSRRFISLAAAGVASVLALSACGGGGDAEQAAAPEDGGPVALDMWVFAELHATYYEQMAEAWNEQNPDRPVELDVTVYP